MQKIRLGFIIVLVVCLAVPGLSQSNLDNLDLDDFPLDDHHHHHHEGEEKEGSLSDIEFLDEEEEEPGVSTSSQQAGEKQLLGAIASAMKRPDTRRQLGQVLPILRSMSPAQRLALAALLSSRLGVTGGGISPQQLANMLGAAQQKELLLPLSMDIANMFQPAAQRPEAMELRHQRGSGPATRLRELHLSSRPRPPPPPGHNRRNAHVPTEMVPPPPPPPPPSSVSQKRSPPPHGSKRRRPPAPSKSTPLVPPAPPVPARQPPPPPEGGKSPVEEECDFFSNNLCLEVSDYPDDAIMASIHRNKGAIQALLADYTPNPESEAEHRYQATRRQDVVGTDAGALCPSMVKYARPKRARATSGQWKFVVNVGDYTQTLRLEMCTKPHESCSFISENFRSTCTQVFNYHRLLTWDESRGLHMDIFKVPTCCSCHIQGYAFNFPPRSPSPPESSGKREEFPGVDFATSDDRTHLKQVKQGPPRQETPAVVTNFQTFNQDRGVVGTTFQNSFEDGGGGFSQTFQDSGFGQPGGGLGFQTTFEDFRQPFDGAVSSSFQDSALFQDQELRGSAPQPPHRVPKPSKPPPFQRQGFRRPASEHLVPPIGPLPLAHEDDFPPFATNQIRRSRNQTVLISRPDQDLEFGASSPQRRPHPHVITSDVIRTTASTTTSTTLRPKPKPTVIVPSISTDASHRRVNYNYHPIIDFFKSQETNKLESRQGQEWTPIIGTSQPRAAASTE